MGEKLIKMLIDSGILLQSQGDRTLMTAARFGRICLIQYCISVLLGAMRSGHLEVTFRLAAEAPQYETMILFWRGLNRL